MTTITPNKIVNGSTFRVSLVANKRLPQAPNAIFKGKTYQMFWQYGQKNSYEVFVPVDYHSNIKNQHIQIRYMQNNKLIKKNIPLNIVLGDYKQNEIIKVSKGKVLLSPKSKKRANTEYGKVYKKVYSQITSINYTKNSTFDNPINSKITSAYGTARVYNGIAKSYHSGTDFRAKIGTKVKATNIGKVALVMDRFYLGKVVYIDHGRGAYSYYCHLSKILVKENQLVKKGDVVGLSGKSGRVTAPHLHYAIRLYNTTVDPMQYAKLYNKQVLQSNYTK